MGREGGREGERDVNADTYMIDIKHLVVSDKDARMVR